MGSPHEYPKAPTKMIEAPPIPLLAVLCTAVVRRVTNFALNALFCYFDFAK